MPGCPPMLHWSVRACVRPQKSVRPPYIRDSSFSNAHRSGTVRKKKMQKSIRPPYIREIVLFGALKPPYRCAAWKTKKCKTRGARRAFAIEVWSASLEAKVLQIVVGIDPSNLKGPRVSQIVCGSPEGRRACCKKWLESTRQI